MSLISWKWGRSWVHSFSSSCSFSYLRFSESRLGTHTALLQGAPAPSGGGAQQLWGSIQGETDTWGSLSMWVPGCSHGFHFIFVLPQLSFQLSFWHLLTCVLTTHPADTVWASSLAETKAFHKLLHQLPLLGPQEGLFSAQSTIPLTFTSLVSPTIVYNLIPILNPISQITPKVLLP